MYCVSVTFSYFEETKVYYTYRCTDMLYIYSKERDNPESLAMWIIKDFCIFLVICLTTKVRTMFMFWCTCTSI